MPNRNEVNFRKPTVSDVPEMAKLVNYYANRGFMLPKARLGIYQNLRDFVVATNDSDEIIGLGALHVMWEDMGEIRSLAIAEEWRGYGLGREIVERLLEEAWQLGLPNVFTLTYQVKFFSKMGFREISKETLPQKIWTVCLNCPKYPEDCDETAMILARST